MGNPRIVFNYCSKEKILMVYKEKSQHLVNQLQKNKEKTLLRTREKTGITRNVVLASFTSFFTDISTEMIYPLLQAFVSMIMASRKALLGPTLGIIEGVAESTASLLKVFLVIILIRFKRGNFPLLQVMELLLWQNLYSFSLLLAGISFSSLVSLTVSEKAFGQLPGMP